MHKSDSMPIPGPRASSSAGIYRPPSSASSIRPSSSASLRPPSSASSRPLSSMSHRPTSSASQRPPSSASTNRPTSSASVRPLSRVSHRPPSHFSQRPPTRQSSRLLALSQTLVTQVTSLSSENDEENFRTAVDYVSRTLEYPNKAAPSSSMDGITKQIQGHIRKARINSLDPWADALDTSYSQLKKQTQENKDLDGEITLARLPEHLHLLTLLSLPPAQSTLKHADAYLEKVRNPEGSDPPLTWRDILAEEPFEGQHWEGVYGLPPGSTVEGWETRSLDSTPPFSPLPLDDDFPRSLSPLDSPSEPEEIESSIWPTPDVKPEYRTQDVYAHRKEIEELKARQYWRTEWQTDALLTRKFSIADASTLGPALSRELGEGPALKLGSKDRYIHEHDAVREVLMALQGHKNLMLKWAFRDGSGFSFEHAVDAPGVVHLTLTSQVSILGSFAQTATTLEHLRKFVACIYSRAMQATESSRPSSHLSGYHRRITRTVEAFSEAVDEQIRDFNHWCADKEQEICLARAGLGPSLIVSFLRLEKTLRDTFANTFDALLDVVRHVMRRTSRSQDPDVEVWTLAELPARSPPSVVTSLLLDTLLAAAQESLSNGDLVTSDALMRVFVSTTDPIWSMVGRWLKNGMPIQDPTERQGGPGLAVLDDEFFVEDNGLMLLDSDFWTESYALRDGSADEGDAPKAVPFFLERVASNILSAGKAVGLLRAMDIPIDEDNGSDSAWMSQWPSFSALLKDPAGGGHMTLSSVDDLSQFVYDELLPHCQTAQGQLARIVVNECDLWPHLTAMEDLFLMRRGDIMSRVSDVIFAKMDARQAWTDFHFLNSAFRDIVASSTTRWIDASLVRLSYRGGRDAAINRTTKAFEGLLVEYVAPFPLTYVFASHASGIYGSIFVFLLQIHRAKSVLERILVRGAGAGITHKDVELKVFYAMRSKLSWFVNTLLDFLSTHVLHAQLLTFHKSLRLAKSLDEIIELHHKHLAKLENRCLLQSNISSLRRAILSILDMSLHFNECFVAFAGDTTHDISRQSLVGLRHHRSRRQKRQRKNAIGFSLALHTTADSSDSDEDVGDEDPLQGAGPESSFSIGASVSFEEEGFMNTVQRMSFELDGLVRFVRRGVESLAGGTTEAAATFGIFAFILEDWDN